MTWFLVTWISFACPGGIFSGLVPAAARPAVCRPESRFEIYDPARLERARRRVRDLGAGAELRRCRGIFCGENLAEWKTGVEFKEESWQASK